MCFAGQASDRRANLLGALAVRVGDETTAAVQEATGLSPVDAAALCVLATSLPGSPLGALADALGLTQPGATRLADRLVDRGLLRRGAGPDGRTSALRLTEDGRRVATAAHEARAAALSSFLAPLGPTEADLLDGLLDAMLRPLARSTADAVRGCRLCDPERCGHHDGRCPVTLGLEARGRDADGPGPCGGASDG